MRAASGKNITRKLENLFLENEAVWNEKPSIFTPAFRQKAFSSFREKGFPSRNSEDYRYTDFNPVFEQKWDVISGADSEYNAEHRKVSHEIPEISNHIVTFANGYFYKAEFRGDNSPDDNIVVDSLCSICEKNPRFVEKYLAELSNSVDPYSDLNNALALDGYFITVRRNAILQNPVQVNNILATKKNSFINQRNLIIVEPNAQAKIIICDETSKEHQYLSNAVTEIFVGENASLELYQIQNQHENTTAVNSVFIKQETNSKVRVQVISLGGSLIRNNLNVRLNGENSEVDLYGASFLNTKQHVDNSVKVVHAKPHCRSNQLFKNVINDEAEAVFGGLIHVVRDAQKTYAFQRNNNLVLTNTAQIHTRPQLIIEADDVKCSHGATVGQIDNEALFYLRARGIDEKQARSMLMKAFAGEVVKNITVESLQEYVYELIDKRLFDFE